MTTATLALIAAITIPGTTEHGNIRPRDIVSTNVEQTVDYIVGRKGYATTNQVAIAAKNAKYEAIDTANDYTNEQIDGIQENIERMQTNAKNYTDSATNETLNASKKYTDKMADTLIEMDTRNWTVAVSAAQEYTDKSTNAVLSSAKSYTDSEVSNIIKQIDYPVTSVNGEKGDVTLTADDIGTYEKTEIDNRIDSAVDGLASEEYVNAKTLATLTAASQNATNYTDSAIGKITFPVESVNEKTGEVTLTADDVGALSQNNYFSKTVYFGETSSGTFSGREGGFMVLSYAPLGNIYSGITIVSNTTYQPLGHWIADGTDVVTEKKLDAKKYLTSEEDPVFDSWRNGYKILAGQRATMVDTAVIAFGPYTSATESGAIAIGNSASASGFMSVALGSNEAKDDISIAIGAGATSKGAGTIAFIGEDYYAYPNVTLQSKDDRLKTFYLGDYNLDTLIGDKLTAFGNGLDFVKTEEDPKFTAWTNETYKILLGKGATADITESTASAIVIGSGARAGNHSIALGEAIEAGENNIFIGSSINHGDTTNGIVIGNLSGNVSGEPQKFGNVIIGSNAYDYYGDSILIGYGTESHDYGTINIGSEALLTEYGFTNDTEKANALFIGDSSLGNIIYTLLYNELSYWRGKFTVENVAPTVIESGNLYCFRPNSTAATAISLSPTFDNGKEDEAKLYLDYTTARSNITVSDSTITVLYEPNSYKLNAFDAPNGQSNRYIVDLKWFATTATENGTKQKFLIVNAKKVSE